MPSYRVHLIGGAVVFGIIHQVASTLGVMSKHGPIVIIALLGITLIGSLFPDIDVTSRIRQLFYMTLVPCLPLAYFFNPKLFGVLVCITSIMLLLRHRGVTHKPWFLAFVPLSLAGVCILKRPEAWEVYTLGAICFFLGALSHIALDYFVSHIIMKK